MIRKLLNLPTKTQKAILINDVENIMIDCNKIANQEWKEQKENQQSHDGQCPKCRARKEDIVNKIRHVQGSGKVNGNFYLGSVSGLISIDTDEVNYCNKCGNEWKKFKTKYISKTDIVKVALNYLTQIYENPEHNKKMSWKLETIQVFDGCCAEAIRILVIKYSPNLKNKLPISNLRRQYKSVFDKEN